MSFSKVTFSNQPFWEEKDTIGFNELILSWNGIRPKQGKWTFWVSLKADEWLPFAEWSTRGQKSFQSTGAFARSYQDVVIPKEVCNAFKIRVEGEELSGLHRLSVCVANTTQYQISTPVNLPPVMLPHFPRQSQQILAHPRHKDLCSPTSTAAAISYLCQKRFDPLAFADFSYDEGFDIYGNWILNIAESYHQSGLLCHVERMNSFHDLHAELMQGRPVVVSVKGSIPGAPLPYALGHLMCAMGFEKNKVYFMDPGFPNNESTIVAYDLNDFLNAWSKRYNLAYVFT